MIDPKAHNAALNKLQAANLARNAALIIGGCFAVTGDWFGAVIMGILWGVLWFALPVTH